jgi:hypothetical protein
MLAKSDSQQHTMRRLTSRSATTASSAQVVLRSNKLEWQVVAHRFTQCDAAKCPLLGVTRTPGVPMHSREEQGGEEKWSSLPHET